MAEFCPDCWNRINGTDDKKSKYILSEYSELCEGCGQYKPVILEIKRYYYARKLRYITLPFVIIYRVICILGRLLMHFFSAFKHKN